MKANVTEVKKALSDIFTKFGSEETTTALKSASGESRILERLSDILGVEKQDSDRGFNNIC